MASAALLSFVLVLPAFSQGSANPFLARTAEEAEILVQNAPKIVTQELLEQRAVMPPSRFRPRTGSPAARATGERLRVREVSSEITFGSLKEAAARGLIEFRQVVSVDDRPVQSAENARQALSQGLQSADDRLRKRMLEDFARNGLVDIATDYSLILLAFNTRALARLQTSAGGVSFVGADLARAIAWQQTSSDTGALEFHGTQSTRRALQGTLWVRASDGLPLRINAWMEYRDAARRLIRDDATVDYQMSSHGFVTPASVFHRHVVDGRTMTENLYTYEPFRLFAASSAIKYTDLPPEPPPAPVKK